MNKKVNYLLVALSLGLTHLCAQNVDSVTIKRIYDDILLNGQCYQPNLYNLCKKVGHRISGSPQAAAAVEWAVQAMKKAGADTVYLQECMVPRWVRGSKEFAKIVDSKNIGSQEVPVLALGGSIATGPQGITAEIVEVKDTSELAKIGATAVKGKIVFFNKPLDPTYITTGKAYGRAGHQRWMGANIAVRYGAIGVVVRSLTLSQDDFPHTGSMTYKDTTKKIPACAISTNGANLLSKLLKTDPGLKFHFQLNCETLPDVKSYNVIGEIRGNKKSDEILTVGGHLDSWDVGEGAHDDGAGVVQAIEVIRVFKSLKIKPARTIRAVAFMNEENGVRGGNKYAELAKLKKENHVFLMESDGGGLSPEGFTFDGPDNKKDIYKKYAKLFIPYGLHDFNGKGVGTDINPTHLMDVPAGDLVVDSQRYFDYHHTDKDIFENVHKRELELGAAAMAGMLWLISEYGL